MKKLLKQTALFAPLSQSELKLISARAKQINFKAGEAVCKLGDPGGALYIILKGSVKVFKKLSPKKELVLAYLQKGDSFGEMSLLDQRRRTANITAVENTKAIKIEQKELLECIKETPEIAIKILSLLSKKLQNANQFIEFLAFSNIKGRLANILINYYNKFAKSLQESCIFPFTFKEIADFFEINVETLEVVLYELKKTGSIRIEKDKIVIQDLEILKKQSASK